VKPVQTTAFISNILQRDQIFEGVPFTTQPDISRNRPQTPRDCKVILLFLSLVPHATYSAAHTFQTRRRVSQWTTLRPAQEVDTVHERSYLNLLIKPGLIYHHRLIVNTRIARWPPVWCTPLKPRFNSNLDWQQVAGRKSLNIDGLLP
jgi:hypothetical protein